MAHCRRPDTCVIARRDTGVRFQDLFLFHLIVLLINIHLLLFIIIVRLQVFWLERCCLIMGCSAPFVFFFELLKNNNKRTLTVLSASRYCPDSDITTPGFETRRLIMPSQEHPYSRFNRVLRIMYYD